jgi:hypothetical protein
VREQERSRTTTENLLKRNQESYTSLKSFKEEGRRSKGSNWRYNERNKKMSKITQGALAMIQFGESISSLGTAEAGQRFC